MCANICLAPRTRHFLLGVVSTLLVVWAAGWLPNFHVGTGEPRKAVPQRVGPWGALEVTQLPLANPDGLLPDQSERWQQPRWYFENYTHERLVELLRRCDLRPVQRKILFDQRFWTVTSNACIITPPEPVIWSLSPRARGLIYAALANCPSNYAQCFPFRFAPASFVEDLKDSGLTPEHISRVMRLAYTNAGLVCFTDLKIVHELLPSGQFEDLVAALYKVPAYTLRLNVPTNANVDALIKYWGKGGREKIISPLIKGLARVPGGGQVNINALLAPFVRARLNTYPTAWNDPQASRQDCFFTSMNFFAETPDTNFFTRDYTKAGLESSYDVIQGVPEYGDLVLILNAQGAAIHMCVYVADDFVFTKNGVNRAEPWVFMRLSDVLTIYNGALKTGRTIFYRHRETPAPRTADAAQN